MLAGAVKGQVVLCNADYARGDALSQAGELQAGWSCLAAAWGWKRHSKEKGIEESVWRRGKARPKYLGWRRHSVLHWDLAHFFSNSPAALSIVSDLILTMSSDSW